VRPNIGGSLHDPTDPIGRLLFTTLSMIAEIEADLTLLEHAKAWPSPAPRAGCAASSPSSARNRRPTSSSCTAAASTPSANSKSCSPVTRSTIYRAVARAEAHTAAGERQAETGPFPQCEPELTKIDRSQATQGQPASCADRNDHENTHNRSAASASRG